MRCPSLSELPTSTPDKIGWPWNEETKQLPNFMPDGTLWPRVSIVTPSFNQAQFLEETIRSVLLQGYPNLEYFVIDGGSTDGSVQIIQKYAPWLAGWTSEKDEGQSDAINIGWAKSSGEFLGWINSDDVLLPGTIPFCILFFKDHPDTGFVYGDLEIVDKDGKFQRFNTYQDFNLVEIIRYCRWISQPGNLIRRSILSETGLLDTDLHFLMDFDFWIKSGFVTKFGYLRVPLARFREHSDAKTTSKIYLAAQEIKVVYDRIYRRKNLPDELVKIRKRALSSSAWFSARCFYSANKFNKAFSQLINSVKLYPLVIFQRSFLLFVGKIILASLTGRIDPIIYQKIRYRWKRIRQERKD